MSEVRVYAYVRENFREADYLPTATAFISIICSSSN